MPQYYRLSEEDLTSLKKWWTVYNTASREVTDADVTMNEFINEQLDSIEKGKGAR